MFYNEPLEKCIYLLGKWGRWQIIKLWSTCTKSCYIIIFCFFLRSHSKYPNFKILLHIKTLTFLKLFFLKIIFFAYVVLTDVSEMNTIEEAKKLVESKVGAGGLNLLINNAGINKKVTLETVTPDMMLDTFNINVNGPLFTTKVIK